MLETTAAVTRQPGMPFRIEPVILDNPCSQEIVVRMVAAGLCHTDLTVRAGKAPFPLPGVLGHEGAGVVEAVGDRVTTVRPGDKVLLSFDSCGVCQACRSGHPALCADWMTLNLLGGARPDGSAPLRASDQGEMHGHFFGQSSFATLALADERNSVRVADDTPLELLAPLGCGIQTGAGTVFNVLKPGLGATIAVVGVGAVGLSAIMAAALSPANTIIAVDKVPERLALATQLGATATVDVNEVPVADALRELTAGRGVGLAMDTTGNVETVASIISSLAVGGTLALVGAPGFGETVPLDVSWMLSSRSVVGVTEGSVDPHTFLPALIDLYHQGRFPVDRLVKHYPFAEIETAAEDLAAGRTIKPVLLFD